MMADGVIVTGMTVPVVSGKSEVERAAAALFFSTTVQADKGTKLKTAIRNMRKGCVRFILE
jgi:hypothetical protein